mgnify:FL=1
MAVTKATSQRLKRNEIFTAQKQQKIMNKTIMTAALALFVIGSEATAREMASASK